MIYLKILILFQDLRKLQINYLLYFDLAISVDCGTYKRLGFELDPSIPLINFDHHKSNDSFGTVIL